MIKDKIKIEEYPEFKRLYKKDVVQCAGMLCPYYTRGCKKS